ncbi:uncharacterized protein LOC112038639 [Quercus suber]|uniref:uncharacterized protein LOC112038639 n=1 Tax=Quercus suber TaxID=58331 RepID=UPI000CE286DF|nr:uncharacterized protein LOC112038639 [Quercus suber]
MKIKIAGMKKIKMKLDFVNGLYVQRQGRGGGLAIFWRKEVNLEIKRYSRHHIDAVEGNDRVYLRLDRALTTPGWIEHFSNVRVQHLEETTSNHCPLLLADSNSFQKRGKRRFFFEAIWTRRADYKELIEEVWRANSNLHDPSSFSAGLKIPKKIQEKKEKLGELLRDDIALQNGIEINKLRKDINLLLDDEEVWWQQRLRVQWLGEGDRNTKYFHHWASERRRKNTIVRLWNDEGV